MWRTAWFVQGVHQSLAVVRGVGPLESSRSRPSLKTPFALPVCCVLCWQPAGAEAGAGERITAANWLPLLSMLPNGPQNRPGNPCFRGWKPSCPVWNAVFTNPRRAPHTLPESLFQNSGRPRPELRKTPRKAPHAALTVREMVTKCVTHAAKTGMQWRSCMGKYHGEKRTIKTRSWWTSKICRNPGSCR